VRSLLSSRFSLVVCCAATAATTACIGERGPFINRMAHSGTTYLSRAARQPVRWQPWGRDAFALAAKLDRPVLLYIGSDTCHWCAETDRAIYTDPEIGGLINALFVPIRVDRDERPDVAQRYQAAVERMAGLRGWPLTVFLTADGAPFFGGTYFPADDPITGRGLKQLLPEVARRYRDQRSFIIDQAAALRQLALKGAGTDESRGELRPSLVQQGIAAVARDLDEAVASRAAAGSVMHAAAASLLFTEAARDHDTTLLAAARRALDLMLDTTAGIAGEDPPRLVRAALAASVAAAWTVTGEPRYREAGRALVRGLAAELPPNGSVFTDQEAYAIEQVMMAAAAVGDTAAEKRALAALDVLLQRAYARGWGVRHAVPGVPAAGIATPQGLLQDQAQVASACLAAHQLSDDPRYLDVALDLSAIIERGYADPLGGFYDIAAPPTDPIPASQGALGDRTKRVLDDVLPGANAVTALVLARLAQVTGDPSHHRRARTTLEAFAGSVDGAGVRAATFLAAARETLGKP
jgi:uncharacterized protein YyaL (SSP411 family)